MQPYYQDSHCTIYNANCAEVLPTIHDVDLVFTSPPYNLGGLPWPALSGWTPSSGRGSSRWAASNGSVSYDAHHDALPWSEYVSWQRSVLCDLWTALGDSGAIFYNHKPRVVGGQLWTPMELLPSPSQLRQIIIWARAGGVNYNETAFVPTHEWIMVLGKPSWRLKSKAASGIGDVWRVAQEADPDHPAAFPVSLPARAIEACAPRLVLDPFMGSGSTLKAAKSAGTRAIGIEVSERYCETAAQRLAQEVLF